MTAKANLLAEKYTFSYTPLVLLWPPLSHSKGKGEFFLTSPWLQHLFKIPISSVTSKRRRCLRADTSFLLVIIDTYSSHCAHWRRWGSCGLVGG